jgi:NADH dehydrogenase [ubiquinone] 1 alpha subcomplex assembly factor 7
MSELSELIAKRLRAVGPMSLADFMHEALLHPSYGYYTTRDPLGAQGDFVTAPELSQVFGELIGLWCYDTWERLGRPEPVLLVELGPGRGTLMHDALGALGRVPDFRAALRLHLVEASETLTQIQRTRLAGFDVTWHRDLGSLPEGPILLVANEFLDALPIVQLERGAAHWHERLVALAPDGKGMTLVRAEVPSPLAMLVPSELGNAELGSVFELCPAALTLAAHLGWRLGAAPGAALIIDYGHGEKACGDTLQAARRHRYCGILDEPGSADLTAHVDFASFAEAASAAGAHSHGPVTQRDFLLRLGVEARAQQIIARARGAERDIVASAVRRLIDPAEMGTLFKVLALTSPGVPAPDGFA